MLIKKNTKNIQKIYDDFMVVLSDLRRERAAVLNSFRASLEKRKIDSVLAEIKKL